jgi:hypothetical protein
MAFFSTNKRSTSTRTVIHNHFGPLTACPIASANSPGLLYRWATAANGTTKVIGRSPGKSAACAPVTHNPNEQSEAAATRNQDPLFKNRLTMNITISY